jgi:hypothetical protein
MKLIHDIIERRFGVAKDYDLNGEYQKSIWVFYQIYKICCSFIGSVDADIKKKDILLKKMMLNPDNIIVVNKLKFLMSQDNFKIESVINSLKEEKQNLEEVYTDFYPADIIGVNLYERGK